MPPPVVCEISGLSVVVLSVIVKSLDGLLLVGIKCLHLLYSKIQQWAILFTFSQHVVPPLNSHCGVFAIVYQI